MREWVRAFGAVILLTMKPFRHTEAVLGWREVALLALLLSGVLGGSIKGIPFIDISDEAFRAGVLQSLPYLLLFFIFVAAIRLQKRVFTLETPVDKAIQISQQLKSQQVQYGMHRFNLAKILVAVGHELVTGVGFYSLVYSLSHALQDPRINEDGYGAHQSLNDDTRKAVGDLMLFGIVERETRQEMHFDGFARDKRDNISVDYYYLNSVGKAVFKRLASDKTIPWT